MILNLKRLRAERIACGITQDEMAQDGVENKNSVR